MLNSLKKTFSFGVSCFIYCPWNFQTYESASRVINLTPKHKMHVIGVWLHFTLFTLGDSVYGHLA